MISQPAPKSHLSKWREAERELAIKGFFPQPSAILPTTAPTADKQILPQPNIHVDPERK